MVNVYLGLYFLCVILVNNFFDGGGNENIAIFVEQVLTLVWFSLGETNDRSVVDLVIFEFLKKYQTVRIRQTTLEKYITLGSIPLAL